MVFEVLVGCRALDMHYVLFFSTHLRLVDIFIPPPFIDEEAEWFNYLLKCAVLEVCAFHHDLVYCVYQHCFSGKMYCLIQEADL